jgi:hypothetical protein
MSEPIPATTELSPASSIIMRIIANDIYAVQALTATSANSLDHATLCTSYKNEINLARAVHSSKNLTDQFTMLVAKNEDLMLRRDATITNHYTLTAQVMQLEAQLMHTLALVTAATNASPVGCKRQPDPQKFTREDCSKLRSFVAILHLRLIDRPGEVPNKQWKLRYIFSRLQGATLEQMIHLVKDDHVNLENFEAFVTSLEEAYGDPDYMNTAEWALAKLRKGN